MDCSRTWQISPQDNDLVATRYFAHATLADSLSQGVGMIPLLASRRVA
jgi:hypothetical protein